MCLGFKNLSIKKEPKSKKNVLENKIIGSFIDPE